MNIKFRIWDGTSFIYQDQINWIDLNNKCASVFDAYSEDGNKIIDIADRLNQYTDLKDRNGVEIYTGDIIWILNDTPQIIALDKGIVEMINGCWQVDGCSLYSSYKTLVVGNIYENPEMIDEIN